MAIVIGFKIDDHSGAMICDEEDWILRKRQIFYGDFIYSLISEEVSGGINMEALYGGVGRPSFTYDVAGKVKRKIEKEYLDYRGGQGKTITAIDDIASILLNTIQEEFKRRTDLKLRALYGFDKDDLMSGSYDHEGVKYEIKQEELKKKAMKDATVPETGCLEDRYLEHKALLLGYDRTDGVALYGFEYTSPTLYLTAGPFEVRGTGVDEKDAAQLVLANYVNRKPLCVRRAGFDRVEVITELIKALYEASVHNQEVGGYFRLVYLDGRGKSQSERLKEPSEEAVKIATELVIANKYGQLEIDSLYELMNSLIFENKDHSLVEEEMFRKAKSWYTLDFILRNYKPDLTPEIKKPYMDWFLDKPAAVKEGKEG